MSVERLKFVLHYEGAVPEGLKRELPRIQKEALAAMGFYWHDNFRAKHFLPSGAAEYGYTPRKGQGLSTADRAFWRSYMGKKLRMKHHQNPLVWSGESREESRIRDIRATSKQVRIKIHGRVLNIGRPPNSEVDMRREMGTISAAEQKILAEVFHRAIAEGIHNIQYSRMVTIAAA